jgi:hypothetical protein
LIEIDQGQTLPTPGTPMTDEEQELIDLLWKDYSPETATKVAAQCATEEERDHALWIVVALQRAAAASAILGAGTSAPAREAALSLLCMGLVRAGDSDDSASSGEWSVRQYSAPVRDGTSPFWFDAEEVMNHYLEKYGDEEQDWIPMLPGLLDGVESESLERMIKVLGQATSESITEAQAILQSEIDRRILSAV